MKKISIILVVSIMILASILIKLFVIGEVSNINDATANIIKLDENNLNVIVYTTNSGRVIKGYDYEVDGDTLNISLYEVLPSELIENEGSAIQINLCDELSNINLIMINNFEIWRPEYAKNLSEEIKITSIFNNFYNAGTIINSNVFLRINQLPMMEDLRFVEDAQEEIIVFENEFNALQTNSRTLDGEKILNELFKYSYEALDYCKGRFNSEDYSLEYNNENFNQNELFSIIRETQNVYLSFAKGMDELQIDISEKTVEEIGNILGEILSKDYINYDK